MPALMVHGNPDTSRLWEEVLPHLDGYGEEVVAIDLPGFAEPAAEGFSATKEAYVDWLVAELETLAERGGPGDLVGHDWGALLVQRNASIRPHLLRSGAAGGAVVDADYPRAPTRPIWQAPREGQPATG